MSRNDDSRFNINVWKNSFVWGIVLVLVAVLILLEGIGMGFGAYGISLWKVALGVLLAAWVIKELIRFKIENIFFPLAFIFMLFEENIAALVGNENGNIISNWYVILAAFLLTIGFGAILRTGKRVSCGSVSNNSFSPNSITYIDAAELGRARIGNDFGKKTVYVENKEAYLGNGTIDVDNSFGEIEIHVPSDWYVAADIDSSFGSVFVPQPQDPQNPRINIVGSNDFGSIKILTDVR